MAVINNHSLISLDTNFQSNHTELLQFFYNQGLNIEINDDFGALKTFLTSLDNSDYPYNFDQAFEGVSKLQDAFALYIKNGDDIYATYAAKIFDYENFVNQMKAIFEGTYEDVSINDGLQVYSSCQWVKKEQRGKKFGMCLDHLKKNISFDVLGGDVNFAIHKEAFKDYHLNGLHYANSSKLATIPNGDVGGAGEAIDKVYYVAWSTKETWASKQSEVRALYTS